MFTYTIGANTVAVLMPFPDVFIVFYSHSRDMHGMPAAMGYSVLVSIEGIQNLISFFHNSCNYPGQNSENSLFELKGVKCHRNVSLSNSLDKTANDNTTSNNHEQQTKQQESVIERENRLAKLREKQREKRQQAKQKESVAERENKLAKQREKRKQETVSEKENRLAKQREKRKQETASERQNRLAKQGEKRKQTKQQETVSERENIDLQSKERKEIKTGKTTRNCCREGK
jgi:type IV secretory pathway VirB10-like protein